MEIKFNLERDRLIKYFVENMIKTKVYKKLLILALLVIPSLGYIVYSILKNIGAGEIMILIIIIMEMFFIFFNKKFARKLYTQLLNDAYKSEKYSYWFNEITIRADESSFEYITTINTTSYEYSAIKSIHCTFEYIFIVFKNKGFILIPNNAFNLYEEKLKFISLLEEKSNVKAVDSYPENIKYV